MTEICEKIVQYLDENYLINDRSAAKSAKTDVDSKLDDETNREKFDFKEFKKELSHFIYEKKLEYIKHILSILYPPPKEEEKPKKRRKGEAAVKKPKYNTNDILTELNNEPGVIKILKCTQSNYDSLQSIVTVSPNSENPLPSDSKSETPVKVSYKYPLEDKILYDDYEIHGIPKAYLQVIIY